MFSRGDESGNLQLLPPRTLGASPPLITARPFDLWCASLSLPLDFQRPSSGQPHRPCVHAGHGIVKTRGPGRERHPLCHLVCFASSCCSCSPPVRSGPTSTVRRAPTPGPEWMNLFGYEGTPWQHLEATTQTARCRIVNTRHRLSGRALAPPGPDHYGAVDPAIIPGVPPRAAGDPGV